MRQRIAVVGAGVIGLLTARALLARGHAVLLLDRGRPGREASWAGGGIVSPLYPWRYPEAVTRLAAGAGEAWAALAAALRRDTGMDPQYSRCGLLMLDPPDVAQARDWCRRQRRLAIDYPRDALELLQPGLPADVDRGLWMPEIGNVRNPRVLQALLADIARYPGLACRWQVDVALEEGGLAVRVDGRREAVDATLVAAGAWSAGLLAPLGVQLPVRPVRGQMLLYPPQPGLLRCMVLRDGRYLIPRRDGRILVGSTLEHAGFDKQVTAEAGASLRASAARMLPALARLAPEAAWAGLRPGMPGGVPCIGPVGDTRLFVNAGHFRNGLVLAPASVALGVAQLLGEPLPFDASPYAVDARRPAAWV